GFEIARNGAPNRHGYSTAPTARWWHAVDLVMAGEWRELLETREFTEPHCIMHAVAFGCRYSHHEDKKASGYISIADARKVMYAVGAQEPNERSATIRAFSRRAFAVRKRARRLGRSTLAAYPPRRRRGA